MSWEWATLGPSGIVEHLIEGYRPTPGSSTRWYPLCGSAPTSPVPTTKGREGERCLLCQRRALATKQPESL